MAGPDGYTVNQKALGVHKMQYHTLDHIHKGEM